MALGRNKARQAREFARCYGSAARVAFVRSLPCAACGRGPSVNAHLHDDGTKGAGRKSGFATIGPLCHGCHDLFDGRAGGGKARFAELYPDFDPVEVAAETQRRWRYSDDSLPW
jgi:hypothetical protein